MCTLTRCGRTKVMVALVATCATTAFGEGSVTFTADGTIMDGDSYAFVSVLDTPPAHTTLTMQGGEVTFALASWNASRVEVYGGTLASVDAYHTSTIALYDGEIRHLDLSDQARSIVIDGRIGRMGAYSEFSGQIDLYDGAIDEHVLLGHQGTMNMYGGQIGTFVEAAEQSRLNLWGGAILGYLSATDEAQVTIQGYGFDYNPYGGVLGYGLLTGWWLDGAPLAISLAPNTYSHIKFIPEPSSIALALVGACVCCFRWSTSKTLGHLVSARAAV